MTQPSSFRAVLVRSASGTAVVRVLAMAIALLVTVGLAAILSAVDFGVVIYSLAILEILVVLGVIGLPNLITREVAARHGQAVEPHLRGLFYKSNQIGLVASCLVALITGIALAVLRHQLDPSMFPAVWICLLGVPLVVMIRIREAMLLGFHRVWSSLIPQSLVQPLLFIGGVVLLLLIAPRMLQASVVLVLWLLGTVVSLVLIHGLTSSAIPSAMRGRSVTFEARRWAGILIPMMLIALANLLNTRVDLLMLGSLVGPESAGIYGLASRGGEMVRFGMFAIFPALMPMAARLYHQQQREGLRQIMTTSSRFGWLVAVPVAGVLLIFGHPVLHTIGPHFAEGYLPLVILCIGQLVAVAAGPVGVLLTMAGHERIISVIFTVNCALNAILNLMLIPRWGMIGAAFATTASAVVSRIVLILLVRRRVGLEPGILGWTWRIVS